MKKNYSISQAIVHQVTLQQLTSIVSETIAYELCPSAPSIFTAAQLWQIQSRAKRRATRKFL